MKLDAEREIKPLIWMDNEGVRRVLDYGSQLSALADREAKAYALPCGTLPFGPANRKLTCVGGLRSALIEVARLTSPNTEKHGNSTLAVL